SRVHHAHRHEDHTAVEPWKGAEYIQQRVDAHAAVGCDENHGDRLRAVDVAAFHRFFSQGGEVAELLEELLDLGGRSLVMAPNEHARPNDHRSHHDGYPATLGKLFEHRDA